MAGLRTSRTSIVRPPALDAATAARGALSFGYKVAVWLTGIADTADRLPELRKRLLVASLGGPVGTLASLGADGPSVLAAFA